VERAVVGGLAWGQPLPEQWSVHDSSPTDFFDVKADVVALLGPDAARLQFVPDTHPALHPGQSARLVDGGVTVGWLGTLHPVVARDLDIAGAPVVFELDLDLALRRSPARYVPVSRFPAVRRDLALLVSADLAVGAIIAAARAAGAEALRDVLVFDVYTGGKIETGVKSVALGLILQETSRTLTDADVDLIVGRVVQALARDCNARIRE
jgi:phenylalanyl-tRNA synthetase beta chain